MLAAPGSGSGKTLVTMGLAAAFVQGGRKIAAFKTGPDYIDPAFLAAASGTECFNLDPWAMRVGTAARIIAAAGDGADLMIVEGVMGLFEGRPVVAVRPPIWRPGWGCRSSWWSMRRGRAKASVRW